MSVNNEINRLNKKAKIGWACFFQSQNRNHELHLSQMDRVENLSNKINKLNDTLENAPGIPSHIANELKELYEITKKEVSCPICLEILTTDEIKFSSCSHKYCESCLNSLKAQNPSKCAICRRRIF